MKPGRMILCLMVVISTPGYFAEISEKGPKASMRPLSTTRRPSRKKRADSCSRPTCFHGSSIKSKNVPRMAVFIGCPFLDWNSEQYCALQSKSSSTMQSRALARIGHIAKRGLNKNGAHNMHLVVSLQDKFVASSSRTGSSVQPGPCRAHAERIRWTTRNQSETGETETGVFARRQSAGIVDAELEVTT